MNSTTTPAQVKREREVAAKNKLGQPTPTPVVPKADRKDLTPDQRAIVRARHPKEGLPTKFDAIAKALKITTGKAHLLYMQAEYPAAIRIECSEVNVWRMRLGESLSWGEISAITGAPESKVRKVYGAGPSGERARGCNLGRGGRKPLDFDPRLANTATAKSIKLAKQQAPKAKAKAA